MKKDESDRFEEALQEAVKSEYKPASPPDSNDSFYRVKQHLDREKKKRMWKRRLKLVATATLLFIGATVLGNPQQSRAFAPVYKVFQQVKDEVVSFFFGTKDDDSGAKTSPPPEHDKGTDIHNPDGSINGNVSLRKQVSIEQAHEEVMFEFYIPENVPEGFKIKRVEVFYAKNEDKGHIIELWYEGLQDQSFGIMQRPLQPDAALTSGIDKSSGTVKEVEIQDFPAILVHYFDGRTNLQCLFNNVYIDISGNIKEEQIVAIANSLK